jgi:hypothetical protein
MSDGDRNTVGAGSGVESTHVLSLSGMFSMVWWPPTGFEPASSWRSNAPNRRSPRVVGKLTARRAMTPSVGLAGEETHRLADHPLMGTDSGCVTDLRRYLDSTTQNRRCPLSVPSAPEGNRTPDLQLERLASLANGDSGSMTAWNRWIRAPGEGLEPPATGVTARHPHLGGLPGTERARRDSNPLSCG